MIVDMQRIVIVGMKSARRASVRLMQKMGAVQLQKIEDNTDDNADLMSFMDPGERIGHVDEEIVKVKAAMKILAAHGGTKAKRQKVDVEKFVDEKSYEGIRAIVSHINKCSLDIENAQKEMRVYDEKLQALLPWGDLQNPPGLRETECTNVFLGTLPLGYRTDCELMAIQELNRDVRQVYACIVCHKSVYKRAKRQLLEAGFVAKDFEDAENTVSSNIERLQEKIDVQTEIIKRATSEIESNVDKVSDLAVFYDYLANLRERRAACGEILAGRHSFVLGGWVPRDKFSELKASLESECNVIVRETESTEENPPILLKNSKIVQPFEAITELYSLPSKSDVDPNGVLAIFYFISFGMIMADAGYGLLLMIIPSVLLWIKKRHGMAAKMMKMLAICGISTVIWGILLGSFFGISTPPILFSPVTSSIKFLIMSLAFGTIHIAAGLILNAYLKFKQGEWMEAIGGSVTWVLVLLGGLIWLAGLFVPGASFGFILAAIGKYMLIAGAAGLLLLSGGREKNIFKRLFKGVSSLYGVIGFFSDILSYSRLLALGLSGGIVSVVINTMGTLAGTDNIKGIILLVLVSIVGHTFNLAISVLGAYVHASRLQYVEFFSKFYTGGGKKFEPLKFDGKYIEI
ncbi:MAG: V-type ATP synthase subunit I [Clostridiales bacterium]|jgi:V/A-type H+-transporting ATPase subunit I|nr:V-type ATP synthase subunit I [Clostridiales bacterium]